ncbi:galactokinase (plasmid) [Aggregatilineales bacterium SYSU G02658]
MTLQQTVIDQFTARYHSAPPLVVRAPGRVNLIGEHTDYNDGFVLPMAIDRAVVIALRPREDDLIRLHALDFDALIEFRISAMRKGEPSPAEYVKGMIFALQQRGLPLRGWEGVMQGDVPIGAGLSSSAALELAVARAAVAASGGVWDAPQMALAAQQAENQWVGVQCGIMDQMISAVGQRGHAVLIDCRDLSTTVLPLPSETVVVVLDTNTRRGLVDSAYNERRAQCEAAARFFGVKALRDVTLAQFRAREAELDPVTARRARHVISENERVLAAQAALLADDAAAFGRLMIASHESLRDDFAVSSEALNRVVTCALAHPACYGARMTGAGFGGCGVALVQASAAEEFLQHVARWYQARQSDGVIAPTAYVCHASDGAALL